MKKILRQLAPWLIAIFIFYFLFKRVPPQEVLKTITAANIPLFIFYSVTYFTLILLLDCYGLSWGLSRFSTKVTYKETILMRGATYLLMLINYNLAQGGIAFYLKRTHNAPVFKTLGTIFYLTLIDFSIVIIAGLIAALSADVVYHGIHLRPLMTQLAVSFIVAFFLWALFWKNINHPIIRPLRRFRVFEWLIHRHLFITFRESTWLDYLKAFFLRLPTIILVVLSFFLWSHAFYSPIALSHAFIYGPIILVIGTLPITPGGVGTIQALCIEFFKNSLSSPLVSQNLYTPEQILLAASLLWGAGNFILKILFGFYSLKKKSSSLFQEIPN